MPSREAFPKSERTLTVGGAGTVGLDAMDGFSYVALGHLHRAQKVGSETVRYSGSLLKYAFSEEHHQKQVDLISLDGEGCSTVESVPLVPRRDVRTVAGRFDDLLRRGGESNREDLVSITLLDTQPILDARLRLSEVYPNVLQVQQPNFQRPGGGPQESSRYTSMSERDLLGAFFQQVSGRDLDVDEKQRARRRAGSNPPCRAGGGVMRPVRLVVTAIGPFVGPLTLDFRQLGSNRLSCSTDQPVRARRCCWMRCPSRFSVKQPGSGAIRSRCGASMPQRLSARRLRSILLLGQSITESGANQSRIVHGNGAAALPLRSPKPSCGGERTWKMMPRPANRYRRGRAT